jgi:hypothetical protein
MGSGYEVVTEALVGHATTLGRVQDQLELALDAAQQVSMPRGAYGVICQFFPPMIDPIEQGGVQALSASVQGMGDTINAVNATARNYDTVDTVNASTFDGAR